MAKDIKSGGEHIVLLVDFTMELRENGRLKVEDVRLSWELKINLRAIDGMRFWQVLRRSCAPSITQITAPSRLTAM